MKNLKKYKLLSFVTFFIFLEFLFFTPKLESQITFAQTACSYAGQCINNLKCVCINCDDPDKRHYAIGSEECGSAIIGGIEIPSAVKSGNASSGGEIGIIFFLSRIIKFGSIVAGIIVMWNFISAGFTYISSASNTSAQASVRDKLTWSIVGIIIIVSAYTIAGLVGLLFFGDATFILNPTIQGAI